MRRPSIHTRRRTIALAFAATIVIPGACSTAPTVPDNPRVVIQAYLYAGEPVADIHISASLPLGDTTANATPINDATVALARNGVRYALTRSAGDSGYYAYPGTDLTVAEGDVFDLEVMYAGTTATARTVVPVKGGSVTLSSDSVVIPTLGGPGGPRPGGGGMTFNLSSQRLVARWDNSKRDLYYVTIEAADQDPEPVTAGFRPARRFIFAPSPVDSFTVDALSLSYYGRHRVRVYHVNNEYAALYESRQQDTRDLNEPATNIRNGLGVFTAFSSATAEFRALKPQ